jgi:hypothetical protein
VPQVEHRPRAPESDRRRSRSRTPLPLRYEVRDCLAQIWYEEIALVCAEHQHTAERIPLRQPRERIAILLVRVESGELVGDNVHRLVKSGRHAVRLLSIDMEGDCHFDSPIPIRHLDRRALLGNVLGGLSSLRS